MDLIPFYARLVATLDQCLPDVAPLLADMLVKRFKSQLRLKDQTYIQAKIKNARFIGMQSSDVSSSAYYVHESL